MPNGKPGFLASRTARVLTVVLLAQAAVIYGTSRSENTPQVRPLSQFPRVLGGWQVIREGYVDQETQAVLKADDTLTRVYADRNAKAALNLFIAFFKTQRTGQAPHSPKNCLPGAGWEESSVGVLDIDVPGEAEPIRVNRYVVSKGEEKSVVLYWYQTQNRVVASEYMAKIYLVTDAIRYNRTDTALVRVVCPVARGDEESATRRAVDFVKAAFGELKKQLPA
jgi:EpsI family protein